MEVWLDGVSFSYADVPVLFDISLTVPGGSMFALLGTNGAGKSTVLRVLCGLATPRSGKVRLGGRDITGVPAEELIRAGLALVPGGRAVFPDMTVEENLLVAGHLLSRQELQSRVERELERFPALRTRRPVEAGSLSGGEQQQLALAKALLMDPKVLCIDELSLGLSPVVVEALLATVRAINAEGTTVVLVEQSLNIAAALCQQAVFLEKGSVVFSGSPRELLERGDVARAVFLGAGRKRG